jgi:hypothetical protein
MTLIEELESLEQLSDKKLPAELKSTFRGKILGVRDQVEALEATNAELVRLNEVAENRAHAFKTQYEELVEKNPTKFHPEDVDLCKAIRDIVGHIESSKQGICNPSHERTLLESLQTMVEGIKNRTKLRLGVSDAEVP